MEVRTVDAAHLEKVLDWLVHNFVQIIIIFSVFIQITPIKWNPVTSFVKWLGKTLTKNIQDSVDDIADQVETLQDDVNANEKDRIRWEILDFANSCRNGRNHTHDEFKHIAELHDKYKVLLERTKDSNGVFDAEYKLIDKLYQQKLKDNSFLK